jgi:tetratricopeptide (TPR) repeat protein
MKKLYVSVLYLFLLSLILISSNGCSTKKDEGKIPVTTSSEQARQDFLKGRTLSENLRGQESIQYFTKAIQADPNFAMAYLLRSGFQPSANEFFADLKMAVSLADKVSEGERAEINGTNAGVNNLPDKQKESFDKLITLFPNDERAHFLLGNYYTGLQEDQKSIDEFKKTSDINPNFAPVYNSMGYAYKNLKNYDDAEKAFKKYTELIPDDPNPYDSYAELLLKEGKYDAAVENYQKALAHDAGFVSSKVGIAAAYTYQGKYDDAAKQLQDFYDKAADDGQRRTALFNMAVLYVDQGKPDMALDEIKKVYAISEKNNDFGNMSGDFGNMATILYETGKYSEALDMFNKSIEAFNKSASDQALKDNVKLGGLSNEALILMKQKNFADASAKAEAYMNGVKALNNPNQIKFAHQLMGMIALEQNKPDESLTHLSQANQQNPFVYYYEANAYSLKGDKNKAKEYCEMVMNFNPIPNLNNAFARVSARKLLAGS